MIKIWNLPRRVQLLQDEVFNMITQLEFLKQRK
jgi:hypothetical protein